ncbi:MAG TPA: Gfo/Idh/MocA family oxidoreductase [Candidatus Latescibacteria bacterium]|nr:Gfo/Idh/MocA family oxidoreductase [Candidatus Latescibacterota bacterium]
MVGMCIVGTGGMARRRADAIDAIEDTHLIAVCSRSKQRADKMASEHGAKGFCSLNEAISTQDVDAVIISTPNHLHAEFALMTLRAGKHCLIEEPFATTVEDGTLIISTASEHGLKLHFGLNGHFELCHSLLKRVRDRVGNILCAYRTLVCTAGISKWYRYLTDPKCGGFFTGAFYHFVDLTWSILWEPTGHLNQEVRSAIYGRRGDHRSFQHRL